MQQQTPFEIIKDLSINNSMKITLTSEKLKNNKSDLINLKVYLFLAYHLESFELSLQASTKINKETKKLEFNMGDILETIFSNLKLEFINEYFLSYYMNNFEDTEKEKYGIKKYKYFGEINLETIKNDKNLFFEVPQDNIIYLKLWQKIKSEKLINPIYLEENQYENSNQLFQDINLDEEKEELKEKEEKEETEENETENKEIKGKKEKKEKKGRRQNEKTIGYAIVKVFKWEKIREKSNNNITLDDAAKSIGMAKKTLDDYKNQIKKGKEENFKYNKYYNSKISRLKQYNKGEIKLE